MRFVPESVIVGLLLAGQICLSQDASDWNTRRSDHFVVYYKNSTHDYVDDVLDKAEGYYDDITDELGFTRYSEFWTWDRRAVIYLFDDIKDYRRTTHEPAWSTASANASERRISIFVSMKNLFDATLPHEIAHVIFREFIGYNRKIPLWLDEGVACYFEKGKRKDRIILTKVFLKAGGFVPLDELDRVNNTRSLFAPELFYSESASIIEFLVAAYGSGRFVEFCRDLRDLRDDQDWRLALESAYGLKDTTELNSEWISHLLEE